MMICVCDCDAFNVRSKHNGKDMKSFSTIVCIGQFASGVILGDADARAQLAHRGQYGRFDCELLMLILKCL